MTSKEHHKHPPLARPSYGTYHRCEWAIYGTTCAEIEKFYSELEAGLKELRCAYIDAEHGDAIQGARLQVEEKIYQTEAPLISNHFDARSLLSSADVVMVNGNHYPASRQVILLHEEKKDSLQRRAEHLTCIDLIIRTSPEQKLYDFLEDKVDSETLILDQNDSEAVLSFFRERIKAIIPKVKALILAGGKSKRMGQDKSQISYHEGLPQEVHLAQLCQQLGVETYLSKAHDFHQDSVESIPVIKDRMVDMGPFGAIVSAMMHDPDVAWLVIACDLPYLDEETLKLLLSERDPSRVATTFQAGSKSFPEPLISIYEPKAYPRFMQFLSQGYSCPRKVLINSEVKLIPLEDEQVIANINTPEELEAAQIDLHTEATVMDREGNQVSFEDIPSMDIAELLADLDTYRIVSLLEEGEHVAIGEHVEQIPYSEFYWNDWEDDGRDTVFYCTTGLRSAEVAYDLMQDFPKSKFAYLRNSLQDILNLVKDDPTPSVSH